MDLDHLNLRVRDPARCRDFYAEHLGFEAAFEADGGYFLRGRKGFLLALTPAATHHELPPGFHIGFSVEDAHDVEALHRRLTDAGVTCSPIEDHRFDDQYVTFRTTDPDGTSIEIYWDG